MATIKDIAKLAGVSHGTVSNVLNARGVVSVDKINAVKAAAAKLGYQLNAQAKMLRAGKSKNIALVLPNINSERYHHLYSGICNFLQKKGYTLDLYITHDLEERERIQLSTLATHQYQGVISVSCLTDAADYYSKLKISSENIIFVYRRPKVAQRFIDIDMINVANDIAKAIVNQQRKKVGIFTDSAFHSNVDTFYQQFFSQLSPKTDVQLYHISSSDAESHKNAFELISIPELDAIICLDFEKVRHIRNAYYLGSISDCPPIYALSGSGLRIEPGLYCYPMNYQQLGKTAAKLLISSEESTSGVQENDFRGFNMPFKCATHIEHQETLNMLCIPSPSTDALEKLLPNFYKKTGIKVDIKRLPFDKLSETAINLELNPIYDVLRIDMATSPWLAEKVFQPLEMLCPDLLKLLKNYPQNIVERYSLVGDTPFAIPFDPSIQMLFYRRDLFDDQTIRRMYYEKFHEKMSLPTNFHQFDRLSVFFDELYKNKKIKAMGSCASIGGTELIATEYLLRYYAQGGVLLHPDAPPKLVPEIAIPVLHQYIYSLSHSKRLYSKWWGESVASFERGELAMLIVYANLFTDVAHSEISPLIGYTSVPGNIPLLGGGAIGISKFSKKQKQATLFLQWLFSDEITEQIVLLGGCSASLTQYKNTKITDTYPWITLARDTSHLGIRESRASNGEYIELHQAEVIIGSQVNAVINNLINCEDAILNINSILSK